MDAALLEGCVIRLINKESQIFGTGIVVGRNHAVTCAHVVASMLDISATQPERPDGNVTFDFPLLKPNIYIDAEVVKWVPQQGQSGDIALLKFAVTAALPDAVRIPYFLDWHAHQEYDTYGFMLDAGGYSSGTVLGRRTDRLVALEGKLESEGQIRQGFSGAPVCHRNYNALIGMVAADQNDTSRLAYMIDADTLREVYPEIAYTPSPPQLQQSIAQKERDLVERKQVLAHKRRILKAKNEAEKDASFQWFSRFRKSKLKPYQDEVALLETQIKSIESETESELALIRYLSPNR